MLVVHVVGNLKKRSIACSLGFGTWNVADIALRITRALLNWKWFRIGGRSPANLLFLYATMFGVDVEEEGCVLLVPDTTCPVGKFKNTS